MSSIASSSFCTLSSISAILLKPFLYATIFSIVMSSSCIISSIRCCMEEISKSHFSISSVYALIRSSIDAIICDLISGVDTSNEYVIFPLPLYAICVESQSIQRSSPTSILRLRERSSFNVPFHKLLFVASLFLILRKSDILPVISSISHILF